jgi:hypothetical protein
MASAYEISSWLLVNVQGLGVSLVILSKIFLSGALAITRSHKSQSDHFINKLVKKLALIQGFFNLIPEERVNYLFF